MAEVVANVTPRNLRPRELTSKSTVMDVMVLGCIAGGLLAIYQSVKRMDERLEVIETYMHRPTPKKSCGVSTTAKLPEAIDDEYDSDDSWPKDDEESKIEEVNVQEDEDEEAELEEEEEEELPPPPPSKASRRRSVLKKS